MPLHWRTINIIIMTILRLSTQDISIIESALNHYFRDANDKLENGWPTNSYAMKYTQLGDIERSLTEDRKRLIKPLLDNINKGALIIDNSIILGFAEWLNIEGIRQDEHAWNYRGDNYTETYSTLEMLEKYYKAIK